MINELKKQEFSGADLASVLREMSIFIESIWDTARYHLSDMHTFEYDGIWCVRIYFYEYSPRGELPK